MSDPIITIEQITPEYAEQLLLLNTNNRSVRRDHVSRMAADMAAGQWKLTGDAVKFNGSTLLDGQHRLLACVKSGVPFTTAVIRNLDEIRWAVSVADPRRRVAMQDHVVAIIRAWNDWVTGVSRSQIKVRPSEPVPAVEVLP